MSSKKRKEEITAKEIIKAIKEMTYYIPPAEKECVTDDCMIYNFEKCFLPFNDKLLMDAGIEVCARTAVNENTGKTERILVFRKDSKESQVAPIPFMTVDVKGEKIEAEGETMVAVEEMKPLSPEEQKKVLENIAPEELYISTREFVETLLTEGVKKLFVESLIFDDESGALMRQQVDPIVSSFRNQFTHSLAEINPIIAKELVLQILEDTVWEERRMGLFSKEFKGVICDYFNEEDIERLSQINGGFEHLDREIRQCLLKKRKKS